MTAVKDFIKEMKKASTCDSAVDAVDRLFDTSSPEETVERLIELSREIGKDIANDEVLGWYVFPGLRRKAIQGQNLLPELEKLVKRRNIPDNVLQHIIDLIDKLYRDKHDTYPSHYVDFICHTAANKQIRTKVRAWIAGLLTRVPAKKQLDTLEDLIATEDMELVEAAAQTVSHWSNARSTRRSDIVTRILGLAEQRTTEVIKQPNVLLTIAKHKKSNSSTVMDALIGKAKKGDDWIRLASCIAPRSNTKQLADIIEGITDKIGTRAEIPVRNLFRKDPKRLESLFEKGRYRAFMEAIALDPYRIGPEAFSFLAAIEEIKSLDDAGLAYRARKLGQELSTVRRNALYPDSPALEDEKDSPGDGLANAQEIHPPYYTGLHLGDALYRRTYVWDPSCHNHWHGSIFQGFKFPSQDSPADGYMQGIHITGFLFFAKVQTFSAQRPFSHPNCHLVGEMQQLRCGFLKDFKVKSPSDFHGARTTRKKMLKDERQEIADTADELMEKGIKYIWWDMLKSKSHDWQGDAEDIARIRCDGVVEYTYEKCGQQVCDGTDPDLWNIAHPGEEYLENHADLHTSTHGLTAGELCPRVQAGNAGTGSSFTKPDPSGPIVTKFVVSQKGNAIEITLNVTSEEYKQIYVRITVSQDNGPYEFAITQENGSPSAIPIEWMFMKVDQGKDHCVYWHGDTRSQRYAGITGKNVFRLVAVDKGGNVSAEYSCEVTV